jgi:hypothetical protein
MGILPIPHRRNAGDFWCTKKSLVLKEKSLVPQEAVTQALSIEKRIQRDAKPVQAQLIHPPMVLCWLAQAYKDALKPLKRP